MKKNYMPVVIVCVLIFLVSVIGLGTFAIKRYMPTKERMNLTEYYGQVAEGETTIVLGTEILEQKGAISGEQAYLPLNFVNSHLNQRYYWDELNQQILYATPSELRYYPASTEAGTEVWLKDGIVYLSIPFVKQYTDMDAYVYLNPARITIQNDFTDINMVSILKNGYVRYQGGIKSPVLTEVFAGTSLILLEELEEWAQVATLDGYIGYIEKKKLGVPQVVSLERNFQREEYTYLTMDTPVNMTWHQLAVPEANANLVNDIANMSGVNVISPTWFSVIDNNGNISSIASADYVALAHERGMKVWGLVDNFSENVQTTTLLANTAARQNLIAQLRDAALSVGIDGINVDFEYLGEDVGVHFLQFLRELSIECHRNGLVLSVDNPVPEAFTSHYDRAEQGRVVDYVIIMGYDEHYVGSAQAGSVASLPWVERGVQDTLAEVPPQRTILAVPFYTRLWKTSGGALTSEAISMNQAQEVIAAYQVETYWDTNAGQNYGKYEKDGDTYQIWLEDAASLGAKVKLIPTYGLAGVAHWKLGLQNDGIWQVISENLYQ